MNETMSAELVENLVGFCENRSRVYTLLSRFYEKEINDGLAADVVAHGALESDSEELSSGFANMQTELATCDEAKLELWAVAFNRVFYGMGPRTAQKAFPYESVYTSEGGMMMQEAYAQVKHVYAQASFEKNPDFPEPEDHLAVELSFMALLCDRAVASMRAGDEEAAEVALRAQAVFLQDHLLNWILLFVVDMDRAANGGFYAELASFTRAYLQADAQALAEVLG